MKPTVTGLFAHGQFAYKKNKLRNPNLTFIPWVNYSWANNPVTLTYIDYISSIYLCSGYEHDYVAQKSPSYIYKNNLFRNH